MAGRPSFLPWGAGEGYGHVPVDSRRRLCACSTDEQDTSIDDQKKSVRQYADDKGYRIVRWYEDEGISGDDTANRLAFQQMLADAQDGRDFDVILCWDQSRFGRFSPQEGGYWTYLFGRAGIGLVTVDKGPIDWNEFTGWLTYQVDQHVKHQYLVNLSRDVARGQMEAANGGSWIGSSPYGYSIDGDRKNKRLVLGDPAHVRIVQRIFREFVDDRRQMEEIARRLQAEGYPSPGGRGKPWGGDTIKVILQNVAYTGDFAAGKYSYGKYHTIRNGRIVKGGKRCRKPESEWIVRRDHHESIIDRPTFERARAILSQGKTGHVPWTPENNPHILSGLLRCGKCGGPMWVLKGGYYECGNHREDKTEDGTAKGERTCPKGTTIREDRVLHSIADYLHQEFLSIDGEALAWKAERGELQPGDLPKAFAKVRSLVAPPKQPANDRKRAEKQSQTLAGQIETARRNLAYATSAENVAAIEAEIERLKAERELLEAELRKRPPSEADVSAEAMEVLRSLYWLGILFRSAAQEWGRDPDNPDDWMDVECGSSFFGSVKTPAVRQCLRRIAGITVHTRLEGKSTRTRHVFEGGEIAFGSVGPKPRDLNPHHPGKSRGCCR